MASAEEHEDVLDKLEALEAPEQKANSPKKKNLGGTEESKDGDGEEGKDNTAKMSKFSEDEDPTQKVRKAAKEKKNFIDRLSPEEVFVKYDADNSGLMDFDEFKVMLPDLGIKLSEAKALKYFRMCDVDNSGEIDFEEFKVALYTIDPASGNTIGFKPSSLLTPQDAFEMFDEDGSGEIEEDEFALCLEYMNVEVTDEQLETLFNQADTDGGGTVDYEEFKAVWFKLVDPKKELAARGIPFGDYEPHFQLVRKLQQAIEDEENKEAHTMAQAEAYRKHEKDLIKRREAIADAKRRAREELQSALDVGGQVYVFGKGSHNQFDGDPIRPYKHFHFFEHINLVWKERIHPKRINLRKLVGKEARDVDETPATDNDGDDDEDNDDFDDELDGLTEEEMEAKIQERERELELERRRKEEQERRRKEELEERLAREEAARQKSPWEELVCSGSTSGLWCRRVIQAEVGENTAFAVTEEGQLLAWGGRNQWWEEITTTGEAGGKNGHMTARSTQLLHMKGKTAWITDNEIKRTSATQSEDDKKADLLKVVAEYYDIWEPPPHHDKRLKFIRDNILPNVSFDQIKLALELRFKDTENMNKEEMALMFARDIQYEWDHIGEEESHHLCQLESEIVELTKEKKLWEIEQRKMAVRNVWEDLYEEQIEFEAGRDKAEWLELERSEESLDIDFEAHREEVKEALANMDVERTARGRSVKISVGGVTRRGGGPTNLKGYAATKKIAVGGHHVLAVHATGQLYSWGDGNYGRLGIRHHRTKKRKKAKKREDRQYPTLVEALAGKDVKFIASGFSHNAAIDRGRNLFVWGSGVSGKLGLGDITEEFECYCPEPTLLSLPGKRKLKAVSCGNAHTAAVTMAGELFVWGCADGGRLGLGEEVTETMTKPVFVEELAITKVRVATVSCGCAHTVIATELREEIEGSGEHVVRVVRGGEVFQAGAALALGRFCPSFEILEPLRGNPVKQVSCGYSHTAAVTVEGELWTWGSNRGGGACQPKGIAFLPEPKVVGCLHVASSSLASGKECKQSSIYNGRGPEIAVNGDTCGDGEKYCTHTQMDNCPWWEVDLGKPAVIDLLRLWNREDRPADESLGEDYFSKRLFPCWVMVSQSPFGEGIGSRALERAFKVSVARKKFTNMRRKVEWELPTNTVGRYVRIQLDKTNYLHFAQLEIFGQWGVHKSVGKVHSANCGKDVTVVVIKALRKQRDLELAYRRSVRADVFHRILLRQYRTFWKQYDEHGDCNDGRKCPLCRGGKPCELCHLRATWILDIKQMKPGPRGRLRRLNSICDHLLDQKPPKIEFKPKVHEDHSIVGQIGEAFDSVLGFFGFGKKAAEKKAQEAQERVEEIKRRQAERKRQLLAEAHVPLEASSSAFIDPNAAENAPEESTAEGEDNVDGDD